MFGRNPKKDQNGERHGTVMDRGFIFNRFVSFTNHIVNLIYPVACINCGEVVQGASDRDPICPKCLAGIEFSTGATQYNKIQYKEMAGTYSLGQYEGVLRNLIANLKYHGKTRIVPFLARELVKRAFGVFAIPAIADYDIIVPVPLHYSKITERGFNQAELLAFEISKLTRIPVSCDIIIRKKETLPQNKLHIEERFENLSGAFAINNEKKHLIANKNVIIVDDIITTGSTIESLAGVLKGAGCHNIFSLAIAKTNINRLN